KKYTIFPYTTLFRSYWKYFIGQTQGLKRLKVYDKKKAQEDAFVSWVNQAADRKDKYGSVITLYQEAYNQLNELELAQTYLFEAIDRKSTRLNSSHVK